MRIFYTSLVIVCTVISAQAEWFERGKATYRNPGGKWQKAAIEVTSEGVQVFSRKDRISVVKFTQGDVQPGVNERRRSKEAAIFGAAGIGTFVGLMLALKPEDEIIERQERDLVAESYDIFGPGPPTPQYMTVYDYAYYEIDKKALAAGIGALAGVAIVIALTKSRKPYVTIKDGMRTVQIRVGKTDQARFQNALQASSLSFSN